MLYANAILPDGTRAMIPAAWTDYVTEEPVGAQRLTPSTVQTTATLGSVFELLHARTVVAPLLRQVECADIARSKPLPEANTNATTAGLCARTIEPDRASSQRLAESARRTTERDDRRSRPPARKSGSDRRNRKLNRTTKGKAR